MGWLWRGIGAAPVRIVLGLVAVIGPVIVVENVGDLLSLGFLAVALGQAGAGVLGYLGFVRWIERRAVAELGGRGRAGEFASGVALGGGLFCAVIGSIWMTGGVAFGGWAEGPDLTYALGITVVAGVVEELAVRGVVFRILEGWLGSWVALALSAALFGGLHLANPGATVFAALAIGLEAGVMLAAAFMVTRRLYLAIGLHMGWNFVQAGVFGVAVSGTEVGGLLVTAPVGPDWLSGGAFGAEASVVAVLWCGGLGVAMLARAHRDGRFVGMRARAR
jgi:membrane protease YdiL (CAAX protease family)